MSRYFTHVSYFLDHTAFIQVGPYHSWLHRKDGSITGGNYFTLKDCLNQVACGIWKEITKEEAERLVKP